MHNFLTLCIGAVRIQINCQQASVPDYDDNAYQNFSCFEKIGNPDINVLILFENMPDISACEKIFESNQSWSMSKGNNHYYMQQTLPDLQKPFWIAEINNDFSKIKVYCDEELMHRNNKKNVVVNPVRYPLDQISIMHFLANRQGAIVHAAGLEIDHKGFIFLGRSGAGKSTLARLFFSHQDIQVYSDDRMVLRKLDGTMHAFGTPWPGDGKIAENNSSPLAGIFFLSQSDRNSIEQIDHRKAVERLMSVVSIPWYDKGVVPHSLAFCDKLLSSIPFYELHFKPAPEIVDVFRKFLSNSNLCRKI